MFPKSVILIGNYHDILTSSVGSYDKHYNHILKTVSPRKNCGAYFDSYASYYSLGQCFSNFRQSRTSS
jgi:hypothetical protein